MAGPAARGRRAVRSEELTYCEVALLPWAMGEVDAGAQWNAKARTPGRRIGIMPGPMMTAGDGVVGRSRRVAQSNAISTHHIPTY